MSWNDANSYCNNLTLYGYSDWRMPTYEELVQMFFDQSSIGGFGTGIWWSKEICSSYESKHTTIDFYEETYQCEYDHLNRYVRPIRIDH